MGVMLAPMSESTTAPSDAPADHPHRPAGTARARGVATASAGQVRKPINRDGIGQWQAFERWLDPLKGALGDTLDRWRQ